MNPLKQTIFGDGKGNCYATCIASLLEMPLEAVPNFCVDYPAADWFERTNEWLRPFGVGLVCFADGTNTVKMASALWPDAYLIVSGPGPRGCDHSVIYRGGEMVHDPHPSDAGLLSIGTAELFVILDPSEQLTQLSLRRLQHRAIDSAMRASGGRVAAASKLLGIGRATLYRRLAEREQAP